MENELTKLQTRVEELEAALAAISKKKRCANLGRVVGALSLKTVEYR